MVRSWNHTYTLLALALLSLLWPPREAGADILFVDLNISTLELEAVRSAARLRHERLVVIPEISDKTRAKIAVLQHQAAFLDPDRDTEKFSMILDRIEKLAGEFTDTENEIEVAVQDAERAGFAFTSLIISGHSSADAFLGGVKGSGFRYGALTKVFEKHSKAKASLQAIYLWGCYSLVPGMADSYLEDFPGALLLGFSDVAPSGRGDHSAKILKNALLLESTLIEEMDLTRIEKLVRSIRSASREPLAAVVNGYYVGIQVDSRLVNEPSENCSKALSELHEEYVSVYKRYFDAVEADGPPRNTHHSDLRDFYTKLQFHRDCDSIQKAVPVHPMEVLALIFFHNIQLNYIAWEGDNLQKVDAILKRIGAPVDSRVPWMRGLAHSRKAILEWIKAVEILLPSLDAKDADTIKISNLVARTQRLLGKLDPVCIPLSWITEVPTRTKAPEDPSCY
jgi:hypothetical protein